MSASLRNIYTIAKRELQSFFGSPVAYVFIVIFLLMTGAFTFIFGQLFERGEASLAMFFTWHPWLYLFLVPAVGMRLWSEEQRMGTMELLLTMPITPWQAIGGKFMASWLILLLALAMTFPVWLTVSYLGDPDHGVIMGGYFGSFMLAGAYLAITSMTSAMTRNQVISFIVSVVICFGLIMIGFPQVTEFLNARLPQGLVNFVTQFGVMPHFEGFQRGVIDSRDLIYFISLMFFSLFTTGVILRGHRAG